MSTAVLLISHGTVASLDELPAFLASIRRGHPAPPELLAEVRRRYEAIGGNSPLLAINERVARKLADGTGLPTYSAARHGSPALRGVLETMVRDGVTRALVLPLGQHSASIYEAAVREVAADLPLSFACAANWGQDPALLGLYAAKVQHALATVNRPARLLLSAHSLPQAVIDAGDPYEREVRAAAAVIAKLANVDNARIVFQSQGMSKGPGGRPMPWLGPDLDAAMQEAARDGETHVVVAPVGFLADHVEILYDLDLEAKARAEALGLGFSRTESLNDDNAFVAVLARLVGQLAA